MPSSCYYAALQLPDTADVFIDAVRMEMQEALTTLDGGLAGNPYIRIGKLTKA